MTLQFGQSDAVLQSSYMHSRILMGCTSFSCPFIFPPTFFCTACNTEPSFFPMGAIFLKKWIKSLMISLPLKCSSCYCWYQCFSSLPVVYTQLLRSLCQLVFVNITQTIHILEKGILIEKCLQNNDL